MSWSVLMIGTPAGVKSGLEKYSENLTGVSLEEYGNAKPHLIGLVDQVIGERKIVKLSAAGHGSFRDGVMTESTISVSLDAVYCDILLDPEIQESETPRYAR